MDTSQIGIIVSIVAYLAGMLVVGFLASRKTNDVGDFYLGGRKLGPFVTAMSAEASDMSSYLLMGVPGLAYFSGIADAGWTAIGLAVGTYLNWLFTAKRLRNYTAKIDAITLPDYFKKRFRDKSNITLLIGALAIIIFFVPYTASGFSACGKLFSQLFGVNYQLAMVVSAIIIVGYTTTGGFLAASTTDFIQSIVMSIALIIVLFYGIHHAGGMNAVIDNANALKGYLDMNGTHINAAANDVTQYVNDGAPYGLFSKITMFCWGLGYFGMPHILLRFMAIEDPNKLKLSRRVASVWVVIAMFVALIIGIIGLAMSAGGKIPVLEGSGNAERVIIYMTNLMSSFGFLPAVIAGVILSGILAATMSTADSQLLASASAISADLIQAFGKKKLNDETQVKVAKVTVVLISIVAVFIARDPNSSVFQIVSFAWGGFGAAFGPVVLLSLFWKRSNLQGAIAGMVTGGAFVFIWKFGIAKLGGIFAIYELLPAFIIALIVNVSVSLLTKAPNAETLSTFDSVKKAA